MNMQISSLHPEIDKKATFEKVKKALIDCYLFEMMGFKLDHQPRITATYSFTPGSETNAFHSSTEQSAMKNVDTERYRRQHVEKVRLTVSKLPKNERSIIEKRFLQDLDATDLQVYLDLGMSESTYYRIKNQAMYILGFTLGLEVLKE